MWTISRACVNSLSSLVPEGASSVAYFEAGAPSVPSKSTPIAEPSSAPVRMTDRWMVSRFGTIFGLLTDDHGKAVLTSYLEDFPARTSPPPGKASESPASDPVSGSKCGAFFARYDPPTSSWKTPQCSLLGDLDAFSETWPKAGTMRNGCAYPPPSAGPCTDGSGFGSSGATVWPIPVAGDSVRGWNSTTKNGGMTLASAVHMIPTPTVCGNYNRKGLSPTSGDGLATWATKFPTPQARDFRSGQESRWDDPRRSRNLNDFAAKFPTPRRSDATAGTRIPPSRLKHPEVAKLSECVHFPTPRASDWKSDSVPPSRLVDPGKLQLREAVHFPTPKVHSMCGGTGAKGMILKLKENGILNQEETRSMLSGGGGSLNPDWVECLMGWPLGWTKVLVQMRLAHGKPTTRTRGKTGHGKTGSRASVPGRNSGPNA